MNSGQDLYLDLQEKSNLLDRAIRKLNQLGINKAESEKTYRIALAQEMLIQLDKGVKVTIMSDICRGKADIAELKLKRDIAETAYKTTIEAINVYKLNIRILEGQINREHRG